MDGAFVNVENFLPPLIVDREVKELHEGNLEDRRDGMNLDHEPEMPQVHDHQMGL